MELERLFRELVNAIRESDPSRLHQPHPLREIQYGLIPYRLVRHALELECSEDHEMLLLRLCAGEGGYFRLADEDSRRAFREEAAGVNPDLGLLQVYGDIEVSLEAGAIDQSMTDPGEEAAYRPPDISPAPDRVDDDQPDLDDEDREAEVDVIPLRDASPGSAEPTSPPILEVMREDAAPVPEPEAEPEPEPTPEAEPSTATTFPSVQPFYLTQDDESPEPAMASEPPCSYCGGSLPSTRQANFCPHCGQNLAVIRCAQCAAELEYGWRHCISCGHPVPDS